MAHSSDRPLDLSATLLMTLVCAIWGGAFVAIKIGLLDMPPLGSAALRFFLTSLVLFAVAYSHRVPFFYQWPEARIIAVLSLLFFYANFMIYVGTGHTTSGRATVFFYTQPLFLAIIAHYFLAGDRLTLHKGCGLILALAGLVALFLTKMSAGQSSTMMGDSLVLSAALATAIQNVIIKRAAGKIHPVALIFWGSSVSSLLLGWCWWIFERSAPFAFSPRAVTSVLYLGLISAAFGFVAFTWLIQRNSASRVTALIFLAPAFGVLFAWLLLHETLTSVQLLGVAGICAGVYIVSSSPPSQVQAPLPEEASAKA